MRLAFLKFGAMVDIFKNEGNPFFPGAILGMPEHDLWLEVMRRAINDTSAKYRAHAFHTEAIDFIYGDPEKTGLHNILQLFGEPDELVSLVRKAAAKVQESSAFMYRGAHE